MAGFYLYAGNRQEELIAQLAAIVSLPLSQPLATEYVMVQHSGIKRWVSMQLAGLNGIIANTEFLFPNQMLELVYRDLLPERKQNWDKDTVRWLVFQQLLNLPADERFQELRFYREANPERNMFQIAGVIADLFDQYQTYRPEIIRDWNEGRGNHWQAEIWRQLPPELRAAAKPFVLQELQAAMRSKPDCQTVLPERLTIFGVSYLPPYHMEVLKELSRWLDIHFFFLNPCRHYWGEILSDKRIMRILSRRPDYTPNELYLETGNPLLSSWGKHGQEFFRMIYEKELTEQPAVYLTTPLENRSLLTQLQTDILELNDPTPEQTKAEPLSLDGSLRIHACHSRMREVEVLKDQLLKQLSSSSLEPSDIVVMTPEIEEYAPLIQSVFSRDPEDPQFIPYSIADRVVVKESVIIQFFLDLLTFPRKRYTVTEVFSLFESAAVRQQFQLRRQDLEMIQNWLERVNVRWGVDREFREQHGVPPVGENTWQFGIDRILSGLGLRDDGELLVPELETGTEIIPFDDIEGSNAFVFGHFLDYFEILAALVQPGELDLRESRSPGDWKNCLEQLLDRLFAVETDWEEERSRLHDAFLKMEQIGAQTSDFTVDIEVIQLFFQNEFNGVFQKHGFMGHGVTFCSMKPMRSIPFKMIALLGMNDKAFPRSDREISFDLSAGTTLPGDRSNKQEDRYLFLETLISAREILYLSYLGQSIKDNSPLAPSPLITELIRYLEQSYLTKEEVAQLVVRHPLQAFSPRYFDHSDSRLFSYSEENREAAACLLAGDTAQRSPQALALAAPEETFFSVSIDDLVRFFDNPVKYLYTRRLGVFLEEEAERPQENEPFELNALENYWLQNDLLHDRLLERAGDNTRRRNRARGILPLQVAGEILYDTVEAGIEQFYQSIEATLTPPLPVFHYKLTVDSFHLEGELTSLRENAIFNLRPAGVKFKDRFRSWLQHLVVNALQPQNLPKASVLIGFDRRSSQPQFYQTAPLVSETALLYLQDILRLYQQGMTKPLAFFPRSAMTYAEKLQAGKGSEEQQQQKALKEARRTLEDPERGELFSDPYFQHYFGRWDIWEETSFVEHVNRLLGPVFEHQQKGE